MKRALIVFGAGLLCFTFTVQSLAALVVFTDRASWTNAVSGVVTENFEGVPLGGVGPATIFPSGISLVTNSDIRNFGFSAIGQGQSLNGTNQTINLPGAPLAFAFDYVDVDLGGASVVINGVSYALPGTGDADAGVTPDDFGFFGVVGTSAADIPGAVFSTTGEAFTLDNLSFARAAAVVSEPSILLLFTLALFGMFAPLRRGIGH